VGHQDRHRDEDRHQDRLRREHQHQDRRDVRHQDHQVRQCEEQSLYVGRWDRLGHRYVGHQDRQCEGHLDHQDLDDCQGQDGIQRHQDRGVHHQDQDGNQDVIHQERRDHLEEEELAVQLQTLGLEEAEWVEHQEHRDREEAYRLVACQEELTVSTAQDALMALG
jgi:hypothetical protein